MAKEKWLINPAELDDFQRDILKIGLDKSYVIKGSAGSGKTILALHRVNDIRLQALAEDENATPSFTMVIFTNALRSFIRTGIQELKINLKQVALWEKWDANEVDHLVVDEVQDFAKDDIDVFGSTYKKSIMLYGDTQQQLYRGLYEEKGKEIFTVEQIADHLKLPTKELTKNYRLPKEIASFASHLSDDKELEHRCEKKGLSRPIIHRFKKWQDELDFIISDIRTRNHTDVGILLPFNDKSSAKYNNFHRNVEQVVEYFQSKRFMHEYKLSDDQSGSNNSLDFDSDLPKVMTFHSSKGLQFETVYIPFCDYPQHDDWFIKRYRNPFYVGVTRTYRNLHLTHSERLTPFLSAVPAGKYLSRS